MKKLTRLLESHLHYLLYVAVYVHRKHSVIGEVTAVTANLNYAISEVERIRKPELAGGALLDVGVYTINFASMVLGDKLKDVQATAIL